MTHDARYRFSDILIINAMKTKLFFLLLTTYFLLSPCTAQVPQGFNYQAIARDGSGTILANLALPVKIDIQTSLTGGTLIYEELFASVTSNSFGLISLVVGTGTQTGGSAASFSAIDWKAQTLYLKTIIQYPGTTWTTMGTSQLWGVPYSLVAQNVAGPLTKLGITGTTTDMEEALFEVKNQAGNTVFAVYNEGIRAYVGNGNAKGAKGGFSVGGYDATKGTTIYDLLTLNTDSARIYVDSKPNLKGARGGFSVGGYDMTKGGVPVQNYLDVSNDSVRIYIDSNPLTKGKRGGFAVGGYDMTKGTNDNYLNVNTDATGIVNPVNRILWYPIKNAFLAGNIRIGTPDSVGVNSFAIGYQSKSRGMYSQAMGYKAIANGDYSTAIGKNAVASSINSFAFGDSAQAVQDESYAIGRGALAEGYRSFAIGSAGVDFNGNSTGVAYAQGLYSVVVGQGSQALGYGSFAFGLADTARGDFSTAIGYLTRANGNFATSFGKYSSATGDFSTAMGCGTRADGSGSTAMGVGTVASGFNTTAMGNFSRASDECSTAMGYSTLASGYVSTAMGVYSKAIGAYSTAMGVYSKAIGDGSTAMGFATARSSYSTVIGQYNDTTCSVGGNVLWVPTDPLFIAGNGNDNSHRSNAFTVYKNGNGYLQGSFGIGTTSPGQKLDIIAGNGRVQSGYNWLTSSDVRFKKNIYTLESCLEKVMAMRGVSFDLISDSLNVGIGRKHIGFIAQELESVVPEVVVTGSDGYKSVAYDKITAVLTEAIKEQQQQIESQKKEIDDLKTPVSSLIANKTAQVNK
jgi:hypothetical protein